jgi:hopanoid biosynthesis associated RND transporter like protein HpnN
MKPLTDDTHFARFLAWLAQFILRHRRLVIITQVVLFFASVAYTIFFLQFDTNRDNLVGSNEKYQHYFLELKKEFPQQDDLLVVVESENPEKSAQFVERLGEKLEAETNLFINLFYKKNPERFGRKALLLATEDELRDYSKMLADFQPFVDKFSHTTNLMSLFAMVNTQFRTATHEENDQTRSLVKALPALKRIVDGADSALRLSGKPISPGVASLMDTTGTSESDIYISIAKGRMFLVTLQPRTLTPAELASKLTIGKTTLPAAKTVNETAKKQDDFNVVGVQRLRKLVAETQREVPGLNVGVTGEPVLDFDEGEQSQKDTTAASLVSLFICAVIFVYGYNETGRPIKATICLIVGLGYTLAFATLTIGHLNILTITFVPMLVGLAIDFGVHLITRYEEELRHGRTEEAALAKAMVFTGQGICTGAFTTAGAFLAMGFTHFKGIQEMGIICGSGLLICLIPMMTLLPVLLLRGKQNVLDQEGKHSEPPGHRAQIENIWLQRPKTVVALTLVFCALGGWQLRKVKFDYNLLNLQNPNLASVQTTYKLVDSGQSLLFAAMITNSAIGAVQLEHQITNLTSVGSVESMAGHFVEDQTEKLRLIGEMKQKLSSLHFDPPDPGPADIDALSRTLYSTSGYCGAALDEIGTNEPALSREFVRLQQSIQTLRKDMLHGTSDEQLAHGVKLGQYQRALFKDLHETFEALQNQDNSGPIQPEDLPPPLRHMFIGQTGKFLLQIYPKKDVWQRHNQEEFVQQLRCIDPNVTGMPVQLLEYTELLKKSYEIAAIYSLVAIVILVVFHFRSLTSVILALLPVAIGSIWLGGLMGATGQWLNPANIMTLPLVIGIGVTNGIHILNRFAEEQHASILTRSTGKAVLVSGLTAIAGFGSLILAKDRGIHSLGCVMAVGITTCMVAGLTFLPPILNMMLRKQQIKNRPGANNAQSTPGREEPR